MSHIFISYSRKNSDCVLKVARHLEAQGYRVWIDVESIPGGDDWGVKIAEGVADAPVTLVFWSSDASQSDYVEQEYKLAVQKKMQKPGDNRRIIPVMLEPFDKAALPELISGNNAVRLFHCSKNEIEALIREIARDKDLRYRKFSPIDLNQAMGDHAGAAPLKLLPHLVTVPLMQSVHTQAELITPPETKLADILALPDTERVIQVYLRFMFGVGDENSLKQVYQVIEGQNTLRREKGQAVLPFFMLHITGPQDGGNYSLGDSPEGFWQGQWLDAVNSTHEALVKLVGQNGAVIQLFNAVPATLNFAIGMQFFKYWQFQLYHHTRDRRYQLVLDTSDL